MDDNASILPLFPTPLYRNNLSLLDNETLQKIKALDVVPNEGNDTTKNKYILNEKAFLSLKRNLESEIQNYFNKVISPSSNIKPYITQSWLNYTEEGQYHQEHYHPNSIISGVYYISAEETLDNITFWKTAVVNILKIETENYNHYNSGGWKVPVKTNDLLLFPSHLRHSVERKEGKNTRISLAFNTFIKGSLGSYTTSDELIL